MRVHESLSNEVISIHTTSGMDSNSKRLAEPSGASMRNDNMAYRNGGAPVAHHLQMRGGPRPTMGHPGPAIHRPNQNSRFPSATQYPRPPFGGGGGDIHRVPYGSHMPPNANSRRPYPEPVKEDDHLQPGAKASDAMVQERREKLRQEREQETKRLEALQASELDIYHTGLDAFLMGPQKSYEHPMKEMHEVMKDLYLDKAPPSVRPPSRPSSPTSPADPPPVMINNNVGHQQHRPPPYNKFPRAEIPPPRTSKMPEEKVMNLPNPKHRTEINSNSEPRNCVQSSSEPRNKGLQQKPLRDSNSFSSSRLKPDQLTAAAERAARAAAAAAQEVSPVRPALSSASSDAAHVSGMTLMAAPSRVSKRPKIPMPTPDEIISSTLIPNTFISPIKQNLLVDSMDYTLSGGISPLRDIMRPAPHIPPPPVSASDGSHLDTHSGPVSIVPRSQDVETSPVGIKRNHLAQNGHAPCQPQQPPISSNSERPEHVSPLSAPVKDPVMEDLSFSSSNTDNSINESNSNDEDDSSDTSDSSSTDGEEDNHDNENNEVNKYSSEGDSVDKVEVKKELAEDDGQGKDSSNWNLTFLFRSDKSEAKNSEARSAASSGKAGSNKSRNSEQKNFESRKSPQSQGKFNYERSPLSEDSSDGEQMPKPAIRPTPQVAPIPRASDRNKSHLSSSDSSDDCAPVPQGKKWKREVPSKPPVTSPSKMKTAGKPKTNARARAKRINPGDSKAKSRAYLSTDESSSDSDNDHRTLKPLPKTNLARKTTPKKTANPITPGKENSNRQPLTFPTINIQSKNKPKPETVKSRSLIAAYRVKEISKLNKKEILVPSIPDYNFVFPEDATAKRRRGEELARVTNSRTSDANKKEVLLNLYAKKDHGHHDPSSKSKDRKKRSRESSVTPKDDVNDTKIPRIDMKCDSVAMRAEHDLKENKVKSPVDLGSVKRKLEVPDLESVQNSKRAKDETQKWHSECVSDTEHRRSSKSSKHAKRTSPNNDHKPSGTRSRSNSRCPSRNCGAEEVPASFMCSPSVSQGLNSRVPLEGESSGAYRSRQSNCLSAAMHLSSATPLPATAMTPSCTPAATPSVPPAAVTPYEDTSRRSPSADIRNDSFNSDNSPNALERRHANRYKQSLPAGFRDVPLPIPISRLYPTIGALEGMNLEQKFDFLFGVYEKKYLERAIALKRIGDDNSLDFIFRCAKYLESFIFFVLEGLVWELDATTHHSALGMFEQTLNIIRWVFLRRKKQTLSCSQEYYVYYHPKLAVLGRFAQSLLSLKVYSIRRCELKENKGLIRNYCETFGKKPNTSGASQNGPNGGSGSGGGANPTSAFPGEGTNPATASTPCGHPAEPRRTANSPSGLSSTPSPAESHNSESSTSSGYNTTPVVATPSPPQETTPMVEVPLLVHEQLMRNQSIYESLTNAHEMWAEAQSLIKGEELETFFACLYEVVCPLTLHSSLYELLIYIMAGLREIELTLPSTQSRGSLSSQQR